MRAEAQGRKALAACSKAVPMLKPLVLRIAPGLCWLLSTFKAWS